MADALISSYDVLTLADARIKALNEALDGEIAKIAERVIARETQMFLWSRKKKKMSAEQAVDNIKHGVADEDCINAYIRVNSKFTDKLTKLHALKNLASLVRRSDLASPLKINDEEATLLLET